jgi:hypothetical protein
MRLTKQQFINRFTTEEVTAILAAEKTVSAIEVWLFKFNNLTPDSDGTAIDTSEPSVIAGVHAFEAAGLLSPGRADEILGSIVEGDLAIPTIVLSSGKPCFHDASWVVKTTGTYASTALVEVQNADGVSCAFQAQFIETGEFA